MTGKIFISCGQRSQDEKEIAKAVSELLEKKLKFPPPYLAAKIDTFEEVLSIIKELASSDYFLFIDFSSLCFQGFWVGFHRFWKIVDVFFEMLWIAAMEGQCRLDAIFATFQAHWPFE